MSVQQTLDSGLSDREKMAQIRVLATAEPEGVRDQIIVDPSTPLGLWLGLLKIELHDNTVRSNALDTVYTQVQRGIPRGLSGFTNDPTMVYNKVKFEDLSSDYHFHLSSHSGATPSESKKLMDLVNKKLLLVSNVPESVYSTSDECVNLVVSIYLKVLHYLLLAGCEYLKKNLLNHLDKTLSITGASAHPVATRFNAALSSSTRDYFVATVAHKLIAWTQFERFFISQPLLPRAVAVQNHLENNIYSLSRYYDNIMLTKVEELTSVRSAATFAARPIVIENLIASMISFNKMPPGTQLDQLDSVVYFGAPEPKDSVTDLCELVEVISEMIDSDT
ncbi:PCI domain-containing protein [[Candida] zeylanoides]